MSQAQSFNGTSDWSSTATLSLSGFNKLSISRWLNWTTFANTDALEMEYSPNYNSSIGSFLSDPNSSGPDAGKWDSGWSTNGSGLSGETTAGIVRPSAGAWHHIAGLIDGGSAGSAAVPTIYVDGTAQTLTYGASNAAAVSLGNFVLYLMSRAGTSLFGAGAMADLALYGGQLLTATQIGQLASGVSPLLVAGGPTYFWHLDGNTAEANLGNGGAALLTRNAGTSLVAGPFTTITRDFVCSAESAATARADD